VGFDKYPQALVNVRFQADSDPLGAENVQAVVAEVEQALGKNGRVLLRKSGTEPLIRVMVEGADAKRVRRFAEEIASEVEAAS
jgi:phosphoglucosamine mutase